MADARNHHFIPQCYLKGFTEGRSKTGKLFVWDLPSRKTFRTIPRNVGAVRDFNRISAEGADPNILEIALAGMESELDAALGRVMEARSIANKDDLAYILNLLMLLFLRNPGFRQSINQSRLDVSRMMMRETFATKERWEHAKAQMKADGIELPDVSYEELKKGLQGNYVAEFDQTFNSQLELKTFDKVLPLLFERKWTLHRAAPGAGPFICTDNPAVLMWSDNRPASIYGPGLGTPGTTVFFPISSGLLIAGSFEGDRRVHEADMFSVAMLNTYLLSAARTQVYAAGDNFDYMLTTGLRSAANVFEDAGGRDRPPNSQVLPFSGIN